MVANETVGKLLSFTDLDGFSGAKAVCACKPDDAFVMVVASPWLVSAKDSNRIIHDGSVTPAQAELFRERIEQHKQLAHPLTNAPVHHEVTIFIQTDTNAWQGLLLIACR